MFAKLQNQLNRLVGPNAAHMIDALIAVALVGTPTLVGTFLYSASARLFLSHHATLGAVVTAALGLGIPAVTALASKFRKAAGGSTMATAEEIAAAVAKALAQHAAPSTSPTT